MMSKNNIILWLIAFYSVIAVSSCKKGGLDRESDGNEVRFSSSIIGQLQGRMTGSAFEEGDAIGVFMLVAGQPFTQATAINHRYERTAQGIFAAGEEEDRIYYPGQGEVDFVAYYPYQDGATNLYTINVADQRDFGAIDLLHAKVTGVDGSGEAGVPSLPFRHELSKVVLNISAQGLPLDGLAVRFNNIPTTASFDLATAQISDNAGVANVSARISANGTVAEAILLPGEMGGQSITFTLGNSTYTWTMPPGAIYAPATRYTYAITLAGSEADLIGVELVDSEIADWTDVAGGSQVLIADGNNGEGPGAGNLFSTEIFALGTKGSWASGDVELSTGLFHFADALIGNSDNDAKIGVAAARIRGSRDGATEGSITSLFPVDARRIVVQAARANFAEPATAAFGYELQISTDQGTRWARVGEEVHLNAAIGSPLVTHAFDLPAAGAVRFKIVNLSSVGSGVNRPRINIASIEVYK